MAHTLNLVYGATTLSLTTGSYSLIRYKPSTGDGDTVVDTAVILVTGANAAALQAALQAIQAAFLRADQYSQKRTGDRVYLVFQPIGAAAAYRSEIVCIDPKEGSGRILLPDSMLGGDWAILTLEVTITWRRRDVWEGPEAQLPLTNSNGTGNTSGLPIYSIDDNQTGKDNYVDIAGSDVAGDLPAAIRVEITNTYNNAARSETVYLSLNQLSAPRALSHILEAEAATQLNYGGTILPVTPDYTLYSGGQYGTLTVPAAENSLAYWTLTGAMLANCNGGMFQILGRFLSLPAGAWLRMTLTIDGLTTIAASDWVQLQNTNRIQELGTLRLPPYLVAVGQALGPMHLELRGKCATGSQPASLDYLQLCPLDGWRKIKYLGYNLEYTETLIDNQIDDLLYAIWADGARGYQVAYGNKILLTPGLDQRLYILVDGANYALRTSSVKLFYRPRRATI